MPVSRRTLSRARRRFGAAALAAVVAGLSISLVLGTSAPATASTYPVGNLTQGLWAYVATPGSAPGVNNWSCRPSAAHPYPVVLVPGTLSNEGFNNAALGPLLANAGYCAFSLNYGGTWLTSLTFDRTYGLGDIATSAQQLASFVNQVLSTTGASKVDIVGHSQGGMMPNYYIKFLGGASKVNMTVGFAPSNHGTTLDGLTNLGNAFGILGLVNDFFMFAGSPSLGEQEIGSSFETTLFSGGDTVPGPKYVVIESSHDEVVTPYTNAFLNGPDVQNILIQNQCPNDPTAHIGIIYDGPAQQDMLNVLGADNPNFQPTCSNYGIGL